MKFKKFHFLEKQSFEKASGQSMFENNNVPILQRHGKPIFFSFWHLSFPQLYEKDAK